MTLERFEPGRVDECLAALDSCHAPGVAVGISIGGQVAYRKAFGLASMELPVLLSPSMRMRVGSISKQFAALSFLLLCEDGKAAPDDQVSSFLSEFGEAFEGISVRDLMCHQSGLRDIHDICFEFSGTGRAISSEQLLEGYKRIRTRNFPPRTTWNYNNGGYLILSAIIERISGQTFEAFLQKHIFKPIGMNDSLLRRNDRDFVANSATLHMTKAGGGFERSYMGMDFAGEGGLVSTVDDMLRWMAHMDDPVIGSPQSWRAMMTPQAMLNGASTGYGLGLVAGEHAGHRTIYHSGGGMGGNAHMIKVPGAGIDVIVITNRHDVMAMDIAHPILDTLLPAVEPAQSRPLGIAFEGSFRSPVTGRVLEINVDAGDATVGVDGFDWPFVVAGTSDRPMLVPARTWQMINQVVTFPGDARVPETVRFDDAGNVDTLHRIHRSDGADPGTIVGRFWSEEAGATLIVSNESDATVLHASGPYGEANYVLEPLGAGVWRARLTGTMQWLGGVIERADDASGDLIFSSLRTIKLRFRPIADANGQ